MIEISIYNNNQLVAERLYKDMVMNIIVFPMRKLYYFRFGLGLSILLSIALSSAVAVIPTTDLQPAPSAYKIIKVHYPSVPIAGSELEKHQKISKNIKNRNFIKRRTEIKPIEECSSSECDKKEEIRLSKLK